MAAELGLRERKKQRTRMALIEAALRLFRDKGYEQTSVAEIAAAADIATRTFFSYFDSKEDIVFFDDQARLDRRLATIARRAADETPAELLLRALERSMLWSGAADDDELVKDYTQVRTHLIATVPALQARELHLLFHAQRRLAEALQRAYPEELDLVDASAIVGALVGAIKITTAVSVERGDSLEHVWAAARRAADIAMRGINSPDDARRTRSQSGEG
ncbi:TetR/AcrR family transcriptional regulator [Saccharopolyspora sp. 5N708]|uniref:TetR/AcrR family transcriptional regulator n=1 Tax=Saccharopolyspora sp. 5N708 TaxID=3457424 RepID=UPI003FD47BC8